MITDPLYVICLKRNNPVRCDKHLPIFRSVFSDVQPISAVNGLTLDIEDNPNISIFAKYHVEKKLGADKIHLSSKGAVACFMSHIKCWERIVKTNRASFVAEDDVNINGIEEKLLLAISKIPRKDSSVDFASVMYLDLIHSKGYKSYNEDWMVIKNRSFGGTQLYYLTPRGASRLLQNAFPLSSPVDTYIAYASSVSLIKGLCYKKNLYSKLNQLRDGFSSSLGHNINIKIGLPESDWFYIAVVFGVAFLVYLYINK